MDPITLSIISGVGGLLSGWLNSGKSPKEQNAEETMNMLKQYLPGMSKVAFSKDEINAIVSHMQTIYRGAANVAAGQIGSAIGESGATKGQGFAEYYTQALAPTIAKGEDQSANALVWGENAYSTEYNSAQDRILKTLGLMAQASSMTGNETTGQKFASGFGAGSNLFATGLGNIGKALKDWNYKTPTVMTTTDAVSANETH